MTDVPQRLNEVRERIASAAAKAGRSVSTVRLVAVSKTKPADAIREAYAAGQRDFGENYVQEMTRKADELEDFADLRWHFIGHLQRNKARHAVRCASVLHTVDSTDLGRELGKRAAGAPVPEARRLPFGGAADSRLAVLVEVNVGREPQKSGCLSEAMPAILDAVEAEPALRLVGLTTIPPHTEDAAAARRFFEELAGLRDAHGGPTRLPELSMGMTHDLEPAILAGATIVRIGTAIFGERL